MCLTIGKSPVAYLLCVLCAVYKGMCKRSREVVVLKVYNMGSTCELYQHQIYREVHLHSNLQHENIITLYAAFQVRGGTLGEGDGSLRVCRVLVDGVRVPWGLLVVLLLCLCRSGPRHSSSTFSF